MSVGDNDPLSGGLCYQESLAVHWEEASEGELPQWLIAADDLNERMLATLVTLQEGQAESQENDQERSPELVRIEAKLELLLEMVSQLMEVPGERGKCYPVHLGAEGVAWEGDLSPLPRVGQWLWLEVKLDGRLPKPLRFYGRVFSVEVSGPGHRVTLAFETLSQRVGDLLEKVIFRQHRRQVAMIRRGAAGRDQK